jgi:UDP-N-acetylmuramoyl-tripeptide--D-alanyl-D-alanine ligase
MPAQSGFNAAPLAASKGAGRGVISADVLDALTGADIQSRHHKQFTGVATNSNEVQPGDIFVALRGVRDGHEFVAAAVRAGATAAVVSDEVVLPDDVTVARVPDTLAALQELSVAVRLRHNVDSIAITGSVGKTTMKNLITHLLGGASDVLSSPKSYNNHIGVPLTLLGLNDSHAYLVSEIGTNHPGEIKSLVTLVNPRAALVTGVGYAHVGNFESQEALAQEKASIFEGVQPDGVWFVNADDPLLQAALERLERPAATKIVSFGCAPGADTRVSDLEVSPQGISGVIHTVDESQPFTFPLVGRHFASTVAGAVAVVVAKGIPLSEAVARLATFKGTEGRAAISLLREDKLLVIDDSYNGSPDSMLGALDTLAIFSGWRRIAALGEMRELGEWSERLHTLLGTKAGDCADELVFIGPSGSLVQAAAIEAGMKGDRIHLAKSAYEAAHLVEQLVSQSTQPAAVLVKAARFVHSERIPLVLQGVEVKCSLEHCELYIRCSDCAQLGGG